MSSTNPPAVTGLLAFNGCDLIDLVGPYEVFFTANRLRARRGEHRVFEPILIGAGPVLTYGGMELVPRVPADQVPRLDLLVVPGAIDLDLAQPDEDLLALAPRSRVLASVCTGAFFLQRTGLLGDRPVTTHWEDCSTLRAHGANVVEGVRWVDSDDVVSSGGLSSGIAMALHLCERFADRDLAEATARQIDYPWSEQR